MAITGDRRLSRRQFLKGLALAGTAGVAAGCAAPAAPAGPQGEAQPTAVPAAPSAVTVRVHARMGSQADHFDKFANQFNQENYPNIFVKTEHFPSGEYYTKIDTMIAGGTVGDIFWISSVEGMNRYIDGGASRPVDDLAAAQNVDMAQWLPGVVELSKVGGKTHGLPWAIHPGWIGLYYNKAMYDAAGVAHPTNDETTDTYAEALKKLTDKPNGKFGWAPDLNYYYVDSLIRSFGGYSTNQEGTQCLIDSEEARAALAYFYDLMFTDQVTVMPEEVAGGSTAMFANNQAANLISGFWVKSVDQQMQVRDGWGCVGAPKGPGNKLGSVNYFDALILTTLSKAPAEAFKFMTLACGKDAGTYLWQVSKSVPGARPDVIDDPEALKDPHFVVYSDAIKVAESPHMPANFRELEYTRAIGEGLNAVWTGQKTLEQGIIDTQKAAQVVLDQPKPTG